ncbi:MAG: hypothetical protein ABWZ25_14340 [Chitinophagaceae bacterium]
MKLLVPLALVLLVFPSCKKAIEKKKENIIVDAMVSGQWAVTSFKKDGTDVAVDFNGYTFQFYENRTVDAISGGVTYKTGTWLENVDDLDILATFPSATYPINLINGNWHIDNTDWNFVEATLKGSGTITTMRLEKQ